MSMPSHRPSRERGIVLVASLLLLLVVTIMALSMFRSYGVQEKIAGNLREKQRALQSAEMAEEYAEFWLTQGNNAQSAPVACTALLSANLNQGQICSNVMASTSAAALNTWLPASGAIGVTYVPQNLPNTLLMTVTSTSGAGTYYEPPMFYISYLGNPTVGQGEVFKIDAAGFGASTDSVAVVESTYVVGSEVNCLSC
jgi:type IV pilus assembly protein PilX